MSFPRAAGILLHPTSLPSHGGVGDFGPAAYSFVDFLAAARLGIWQVLPLNAPGYGNSPYGCLSSYAGNVLLILPRRLVQDGLLPDEALDDVARKARTQIAGAGADDNCIDLCRRHAGIVKCRARRRKAPGSAA